MNEINGLAELLKNGGPYGLLALSLWVNYMFYREIRNSEKERRLESKADTDKAWLALNASSAAAQAQATATDQLTGIIKAALVKGGPA